MRSRTTDRDGPFFFGSVFALRQDLVRLGSGMIRLGWVRLGSVSLVLDNDRLG